MICDCDGVLIDSEAVAARVLIEQLHTLWPSEEPEPILMPLLGLRIETVLARTAEALNRSLDAFQIEQIRRAVESAAVEAPAVQGVAQALGSIPLRKACASNSSSSYVEAALFRTGLVRFFGDRRYTADLVAHPKPAPDVYLLAARTLRVPVSHCLVVEDSAAGVAAATAAGMSVLGFVGGGHATEGQVAALQGAGASTVFDDMRMLPALAADWINNAAFEVR
ncbi:HAD family hydrolase [Caballeronia arvi]|nr:HAD family phosphatase [Caballeronia arvi]